MRTTRPAPARGGGERRAGPAGAPPRRRRGSIAVRAVLSLLPAAAAVAQEFPEPAPATRVARVVEVIDGDTIALEGGAEARLVGVMAPGLSLGRGWVADEPFALEARDALEALVLGRTVALVAGETPVDRHGRMLAHVVTGDGVWVQGRMLRSGLARVSSRADNRAHTDAMLGHEAAARAASAGLWSDPFFAVRDARRPDGVRIDRFEVVEGVVAGVAEIDRRVYVNFGDDWRADMTVTVSPHDRSAFREGPLDLLALEGVRVRVRGWTGRYNGPMMEIDHPEAIEVLE